MQKGIPFKNIRLTLTSPDNPSEIILEKSKTGAIKKTFKILLPLVVLLSSIALFFALNLVFVYLKIIPTMWIKQMNSIFTCFPDKPITYKEFDNSWNFVDMFNQKGRDLMTSSEVLTDFVHNRNIYCYCKTKTFDEVINGKGLIKDICILNKQFERFNRYMYFISLGALIITNFILKVLVTYTFDQINFKSIIIKKTLMNICLILILFFNFTVTDLLKILKELYRSFNYN